MKQEARTEAGIQKARGNWPPWIPAYAGMTVVFSLSKCYSYLTPVVFTREKIRHCCTNSQAAPDENEVSNDVTDLHYASYDDPRDLLEPMQKIEDYILNLARVRLSVVAVNGQLKEKTP